MAFHIKIGNYRFSKNLGTGSFGKVKLAFNDVTGHKVAIKILNKKKIKQQGVFEKVKREIKVLRQFNHPHIIKHYEFIDTPSDIFMVIEFASGGELFDLISRRERLPEDDARRFFQQIYSSIEYTHVHKIAHRDLKPENLLLDEFNNIKLIDFGLANSMKDSQALKTACGSPNYAAPEVISGRSYGGVEVDVWSLGVILYAMVCGSLPFDDESMSALFNKIKEGKYFMPNYISSDVKDLINRMLQPNPVKRINMKEIKEHPWYLKDLPQYLQDLSRNNQKTVNEIDLEIVSKLFTLTINLQGRTEEDIIKAIKDKKNTDFCGVYELYYHDKLKMECFKIQHQEDDDPFDSNNNTSSTTVNPHKFSHFKTLRHTLIHSTSDVSTPVAAALKPNFMQPIKQTNYSLLTIRHTDRLGRIISKFRSGETKLKPKIPIFGKPIISDVMESSVVSTEVETTVMKIPMLQQQITKTSSRIHETSDLFIQRHPHPHHQRWVFGLIFKGTPIDLMSLTCEVLRHLEIEWQIIPKDLKLKCRSRIDENSVTEYEQSLQMMDGEDVNASSNKDEMIKEFLRKNFVKFYINIYKDQVPLTSSNSKSSNIGGSSNALDEIGAQRYMLDIHLFKGTVYVFMDFVRKFMHLISTQALCITNSCSSNHESNMDGESNNIMRSRTYSGNRHHDYNLKIIF